MILYTPVFRPDVLWYGDVCPSVRPSFRPSFRPSVRPSGSPSGSPSVSHSFPHFSPTCFDILSWNFACHFLLMNIRSSSSAVNFRQVFVGVMPLLKLKKMKIHSFPQFSPTCFDILSWNFAYDFVVLYFRSSSSLVNLRQFLLKLCPFWNLEYWKYTVFRAFLLHALTYWAKILHMTLSYCTTD